MKSIIDAAIEGIYLFFLMVKGALSPLYREDEDN